MKLRSFKKQLAKTGSSAACKKEPKTSRSKKEKTKKKKTLHTCEECGKSFKFKSVLLKHVRIHSTERPFECKVCGADFKQYGCLLAHSKIHAPPRFPCQECGKQYYFKTKFRLHSLRCTHNIEKSHVCSECGKCFASEERLKLHQKIHQKASWHKKENVPFTCNICNQTFKYFKNLKVHERIHSIEKIFSCRECWKVFSCEGSLQKHLKQHAEGQKVLKGLVKDTFSCAECKRTFQREASLIIHQCSAQAEKPFKCMTCGQTFKSESNLQAHGQVHTGEQWHSCEECGEGFKRKDYLWQHELRHTGQKAYECGCCWRLFESDSALKSHMKISNHLRAEILKQGGHLGKETFPKTTSNITIKGDKSFKCTTCGMHFNHDIKRLVHERFHTNENDYSCIQCTKCFKSKIDLWNHLPTHTRNRNKSHGPYKCNDCGKTFTTKSSQTKHKRIHTGEMPYKCADCGKTYRWRGLLEGHKRTHTGEKPYQCDHCEKRFAYYSSFSVHRKIHSAVKAFKCLKCERTFAYSHQLIRHQAIHMEEKQFSCSDCGKKYWFKETLRSHRKSHTGGSRFSCTECKKTFARKKDLKVHLRLHTLVMSHQCAECGKSFISEMELHNHFKCHNGQNVCSYAECGKSFTHKRYLYRHEKRHSLNKPCVCSICGKSFKSKPQLSSHEKIPCRKIPFSCSDDGKSLNPMTKLSSHHMVQSKEKSNNCTASKRDLDEAEHLRLDQTSSLNNPLAVHQSEKTVQMPTITILTASVPTIVTHQVTILWLGKPDAAISKVAIPQLGTYSNGHKNINCLGQEKQPGVEQTTSVENSLPTNQNDQTGEMPAAATRAASISNGVTHNRGMTRVNKFADSISSAMNLVAVAKRTARKSYLRTFSVVTPVSDKTFKTHSEPEFPVIAMPEAVATPPPTIPNTSSVTCTPNASVTPNQETPSQPCVVSTSEMSFWCADCGVGWKDKASFSAHQKSWHETKSAQLCMHCVETFHSKFDFEKHSRTHRSDLVVDMPASTLPAVTTHSSVLPAVTESVNTAPPAGVVVVPKSEDESPSAIADSTATHSAVIPAAVTCATCGASFHQMSILVDHLKTHVANGCNDNGCKQEENPSGLCGIESAERSFCCDLCMLDFKSEALFIEHLRCCPSTSLQKPYECCEKSFRTKLDFDEHCKTHMERLCLDPASVIAPSITLPAPTTSTVTMPSVTQFADSVLNASMPAAAQPASTMSSSGTVAVASSPVDGFVLMVPTLSVAIPDASAVCYNPNISGIHPQEALPPLCESSLTEGDYWCVDCSMGFRYKSMLGRHRTIWHTVKKLKPCPKCDQTFSTRFENEMHRNVCTDKIRSLVTPAGIAPPVATLDANKPIVYTPARTETNRASPNVAKHGVHLYADSPATNVPAAVIPAANIPSVTPHYVTIPADTISATATSSETLYAANKDSLTELNDIICPISKPAARHSVDMPAETNSVVSMPFVTERNDTVPIVVKHADPLLEAMIRANILTETKFAEKQLSGTLHIEEMYAPTEPEGRKPVETTTSSSRPAPGIASMIQFPATNPDNPKLVANPSASSMPASAKPVLKVLADPTFIVGRSETDEPAVTTCPIITPAVTMSITAKTHSTPSEVTVSPANKPVSMESADSAQIERSPTTEKPMADYALTTCKATNSTMAIPTVTKPTSVKLALEEIGENMLIQGKHAVVMPAVSKPDLIKPNMMRTTSLGLNDLIPNVASPRDLLCEDMPTVTMSEATRPAAMQCDATLLIEGKTTVCQSTLTTPSTTTFSITSATSTSVASSHTVTRPALLTSAVSAPAVKELDDRTLNEGKTTSSNPATTTTAATSPVAAMPNAVTQVTITQDRDGLDQNAVLLLRWKIHPAMGSQVHEEASAPADDSIGCPKNPPPH
ncbi:uncharacterized protein LOC144784105 isoform X2 [Lissotriton helveticus]